MKPGAGICLVIGLSALGYAFFESRAPVPQKERGQYEDLDSKAQLVATQIIAIVVGFVFLGISVAVQYT